MKDFYLLSLLNDSKMVNSGIINNLTLSMYDLINPMFEKKKSLELLEDNRKSIDYIFENLTKQSSVESNEIVQALSLILGSFSINLDKVTKEVKLAIYSQIFFRLLDLPNLEINQSSEINELLLPYIIDGIKNYKDVKEKFLERDEIFKNKLDKINIYKTFNPIRGEYNALLLFYKEIIVSNQYV